MPTCEPIGVAHTPLASGDDAPRQGFLGAVEGTIELDPEYAPGVDGYTPGDAVLVVWFADRADRDVLTLRDGRGVFTTRSPARPNPVCLTTVAVRRVEGATLAVRGVDMLDGSPVLDLKRPLDPDRRGG